MTARLVLVLSLLASASVARAQSGGMGMSAGPNGFNMNFQMNDGQQPMPQGNVQVTTTASAHEEFSSSKPGETYKITYDSDPAGKTRFKILAPESFGVRVSDNGRELVRDQVPAAFDAIAGHFYRVEIFTSEAVLFDKKFEAKPGMLAQLWITAGRPQQMQVAVQVQQPAPAQVVYVQQPAPQPQVVVASAPACMGASDLGSIRGAIEEESFSDGKIQVLGTALEGRSLCVAQVVEVIGLFDFSADKIKALRMMAPHIADRSNNFKIYGAFDFESDKQQAKAILR